MESLPTDLHRVVPVLINDALGLCSIFLLGLGLPPIDEVAIAISLASLVIKPVGDLVASNEPQGSVVDIARSAHIKDQTGEDASADVDCIQCRSVKRIHLNSGEGSPIIPVMNLPGIEERIREIAFLIKVSLNNFPSLHQL